MLAKKEGTCHETKKSIKKNQRILYVPPVKGIHYGQVFHEKSKAFKHAVKNPANVGFKDNQ